MKTILTLLLLTIGFGAVAQRSSYRKEVTNDGRELRIRVDIDQPGRSIHYRRSFDVADMGEDAAKALENQVLDSLGVNEAQPKTRVGLYTRQKSEARQQAVVLVSNMTDCTTSASATESVDLMALGETTPTSVLHREDKENARLWMQYIFDKDGEEVVFERTANVAGKSDREKKQIILETERSLGIKPTNQ